MIAVLEILDIIKFVAENYSYDSEYDGRVNTICFYCGAETIYNKKRKRWILIHENDCLHLKAEKILEHIRRNL